MLVPAICDCGAVWFSSSFMHIQGGGSAQITGSKVGPCPHCKQLSRIPDGIYRATSIELFRSDQASRLAEALQSLGTALKEGRATREETEQKIKNDPFLSPLGRYLPQDSTQLLKWLSYLTGTAIAVAKLFGHPQVSIAPQDAVAIPEGLHEVYSGVGAAHTSSPVKLRT